MQLHQLAYALAVAEEESFTRAADRLHLAQPSLSRQIRLLEHELGVLLFNRGPGQGRVTLTTDGAALLPFMQRVLADVQVSMGAIGCRGPHARSEMIWRPRPGAPATEPRRSE